MATAMYTKGRFPTEMFHARFKRKQGNCRHLILPHSSAAPWQISVSIHVCCDVKSVLPSPLVSHCVACTVELITWKWHHPPNHNLLQRRQRKTKPQPWVTWTENWCSLDVWFQRYACTMHAHVHISSTFLCATLYSVQWALAAQHIKYYMKRKWFKSQIS